jgi:hypothetical protein
MRDAWCGAARPLEGYAGRLYVTACTPNLDCRVESHSVLGTLWAGLGMGAYYMALIWINLLLGAFLTPLFLIPGTWLLDVVYRRRRERAALATR